MSRGHSINSVNHRRHRHLTLFNSNHFGIQKVWNHTQLHHFIILLCPKKLECFKIIWNQFRINSKKNGINTKTFGIIFKTFGIISKHVWNHFQNIWNHFVEIILSIYAINPRGQGSQFFESCLDSKMIGNVGRQ